MRNLFKKRSATQAPFVDRNRSSLSKVLCDLGYVSEEQLREVYKHSPHCSQCRHLGETLVFIKSITQEQLEEALHVQARMRNNSTAVDTLVEGLDKRTERLGAMLHVLVE